MKLSCLAFSIFLMLLMSVELEAQQFSSYPTLLRRGEKFYVCTIDPQHEYYSKTDITDLGYAWSGRNDYATANDCATGRMRESFRMMLKWDNASIPDDATIKSVRIELWYESSSTKTGSPP